jgi:hypothetical protein
MPDNTYERVENIEERAQRLMLLGVVKVLNQHTLMLDFDPPDLRGLYLKPCLDLCIEALRASIAKAASMIILQLSIEAGCRILKCHSPQNSGWV